MDFDDRELVCCIFFFIFDLRFLILMFFFILWFLFVRGLLLFEFVCLLKECFLDLGRFLLI